ncbi:hypothetical protein [Actinocrispum sp. NPDC049592]|uniref:hypothetical protein n=1 Tax=Actinocrispum sp. NPDC049592 TaxID=3154835 RepID=UPI0034170B39
MPLPPKALKPRPKAAAQKVAVPPRMRPRKPVPVSNAAVQAAVRADRKPLPDKAAPVAQDEVGNAAVARRRGPATDPKFAVLKKDVQHKKKMVASSHPPPRAEAVSAQDASVPPKDDAQAQGKTANAEKMNEAKPKEFDKAAFIAAVEKAIEAKTPKNLDEADKFADSGKPEEVKAEVQGQVGDGKKDSAEDIADTTAAAPDTSVAVEKKVTPMAPDRPPGAPAAPDPANAVPDRQPASATDMSAGPAQVNQQMADAQVTEPQLRKSNEPTFNQALQAKGKAEEHSEAAPPQLRKAEAVELKSATTQAKHHGGSAMAAMGARRVATGQQVGSGKKGAKSRDEDKRAEVTAGLQKVFDTMKTDVEAILSGLDTKVDEAFTKGEKDARIQFTLEYTRKMNEYKDARYSGIIGKAKWVKDQFAGLPDEVNKFYDEARTGYVSRMRQVISTVADIVGAELTKAKTRIAKGRDEMQAYVRKLPADLQAIGKDAMAGFADKFEELTQSVDDKGNELVDTLASKYVECLKAVDDQIAAEKEKNKGLVDKAIGLIGDVIRTIKELMHLLLAVLAKAGQVVHLILASPVTFLGNLVTSVGAGLKLFGSNIVRHLEQGIMTWLLGRAAEAGLQLPAKFDTRGVLTMLAGLIGLTPQAIWARVTRRLPPQAAAAAESAVPLAAEVRKRGVAGMWEDLKTRIGDLRKDLLDKVIQYVTPTIVMAGITWILSLLNPASAFVRAVKLIIDIVRFIVTQARQIFDFVNAVLDAMIAIARGGTGGVPALIERALARSIPVLLGFLASLLGIGGIAAKVKQIVQAMSKPVGRAIDWVVDKIVALVKKAWSKLKGAFSPKKPKRPRKPKRPFDHAGPHRPKRPAKPHAPKKRHDKHEKEPDKKVRLRKAMDAAVTAVKALGDKATPATVNSALAKVKAQHGLTKLTAVHHEDVWRLRGALNPEAERDVPDATDEELRLIDDGVASVEERRAVLTAARGLVRNEAAISAVFDRIRQNQPGRKKAIRIFQSIVKNNLRNGYRIDAQEKNTLSGGRQFDMHYYGLHISPLAAVGGVRRALSTGLPLGFAYVKAVSVPQGEIPVAALAFDLFIHPAVTAANIKGVGSEMFKLAAAHFKTEYEAVVAEWGRFDFYTKGGRADDMSDNLKAYIAARRAGKLPEVAVRATWTYRRADDIYGHVPLHVQVEEAVDLRHNDPPRNALAVRATIRPR